MFPAPPPWEGLHVLVVHMPIGIMLTASLFVFLAALFPRWAGTSALILLVLGTVGSWVAVSTGEAARDIVEDGPEPIWDLMERHEELADMTLTAFAGLTVLYALILVLPLLWQKAARPTAAVIMNLTFLVLLLGANLLLANTAHLGGHLVHLYGVRAQLGLEAYSSETDGESADSAAAKDANAEPATGSPAESSSGGDVSEPPVTPESAPAPAAANDSATTP